GPHLRGHGAGPQAGGARMNKKKLPKAIVWTAEDMRKAGTGGVPQRETPGPAVMNEPAAAPRAGGATHNIIEMLPKPAAPQAAPAGGMNTQAAAGDINTQAAPAGGTNTQAAPGDMNMMMQRRALARGIVERHANLCAVSG